MPLIDPLVLETFGLAGAATARLLGSPDTPAIRRHLQAAVDNSLRQLQSLGQISAYNSTTGTQTLDNAEIWPSWNLTLTGGSGVTTSSTVTNQTLWSLWTASNSNSTLVINQALTQSVSWGAWNETYSVIQEAAADVVRIQRYSRRKLSEAELLAELEREKRYRLHVEEQQRQAAQALARAEKLLRSCLTEAQVEDLEKRNCFYIEIPREGGKKERYRIDRGTHGNVKQLDDKGSILRSFCIQPEGVPVPDSMLTQKLWLEASDETRAKFWETANITHLVREKEVPAHIPRRERHAYARAHGLLH